MSNLDIRKQNGKIMTFKMLWVQEQYKKLRRKPKVISSFK